MQPLTGDLNKKQCSPIAKDAKPLIPSAYEAVLQRELHGWHDVDEKSLERQFAFNNFKEALAFVIDVGELAEQQNHHPDISLHGWNKVTLNLSTHSIGGLSENDFIMASKINLLHTGA